MRDYSGRTVVVAGAGRSGAAAARALAAAGATVSIFADRPPAADPGYPVFGDPHALPAGTAFIVTSPGLRPAHPLFAAAATASVPVIGEVELAWQLRPPPDISGTPAPWLALTGTNGKTTTVGMLTAILAAAGTRVVATGNVGYPLTDAVLARPRYDVLAVELSSAQLHFAPSIRPAAAAILNIAADHLDWHACMQDYVADKARILAGDGWAVVNADDAAVAALAAGRPRVAGFTLRDPAPGQLGVSRGMLVDAAFGDAAGAQRVPLAPCQGLPPGAHNVANALAAAGLARAYGVPPAAVARGLAAFVPAPHRNTLIGHVAGVAYVDDSKATNPHAAAASLRAYRRVVWIAGGLLKGADVEPLVAEVAGRLAGAVLLGTDAALIAAAIARHAPSLPVVSVTTGNDQGMPAQPLLDPAAVMARAVALARSMATPGDVVLLAPAAASTDQFSDYNARGDAFAAAVAGMQPTEGA